MRPSDDEIKAKRLKLELEILEDQQAQQNRLNGRASIISEKEQELASAISPNTERALQQAVKHFIAFTGQDALPCNADALYNYLIYYSGDLKVSTLEQRRRMIGLWHKKEGYNDPNDDKRIRLIMRRIRKTHNAPPKQAKPATGENLLKLDSLFAEDISAVKEDMSKVDNSAFKKLLAVYRTLLRDRAMLLVGFWFGLRSDELAQIKSSHLAFYEQSDTPYFTLFLPKSKADKDARGRTMRSNAKPALCAMTAVKAWLDEKEKIYPKEANGINRKGLTIKSQEDLPLFNKVHWLGNVQLEALKANSVNPILKPYFERAGLGDQGYSSHSLRRGLANWLMNNGANLHEVMEHIGWADVNTAMRYLDGKDALPDQLLEKAEVESKQRQLLEMLLQQSRSDDARISASAIDEWPGSRHIGKEQS